MPDLSLDLRCVSYQTELHVPIDAWRAYAEVLFEASGGARVSYFCIIDPGAAFSVLPFSLWHDRHVTWMPLGSQLVRPGRLPEALAWQGTACDLGSTTIHILDGRQRVQAGPFVLVAKFPRQRLPRHNLETIALLGMNLLTDNLLHLALDGTSGSLFGRLVVP